jgi:hypothetical protein
VLGNLDPCSISVLDKFEAPPSLLMADRTW